MRIHRQYYQDFTVAVGQCMAEALHGALSAGEVDWDTDEGLAPGDGWEMVETAWGSGVMPSDFAAPTTERVEKLQATVAEWYGGSPPPVSRLEQAFRQVRFRWPEDAGVLE